MPARLRWPRSAIITLSATLAYACRTTWNVVMASTEASSPSTIPTIIPVSVNPCWRWRRIMALPAQRHVRERYRHTG